ncbi:helix-turn-helix domain-containing protein [Arthrobacter sp. H14-L1]|uniref:helix-turn-helix domain-containing protein n=1 Tax=Arthrobacter sp. H14-L1 TaxID=2996697 RepID=UPI003B641285
MDKKFDEVELLTVAEVATKLRVSRMTVYRKVRSAELPAVHFGKSIRVPATAIEAYLLEGISTQKSPSRQEA